MSPKIPAAAGQMVKIVITLTLIVVIMVVLPGCKSYEGDGVTTEYERMLGYVPTSAIDEFDIWYIDQARLRQLYGLEDIITMEQLRNLPEERRESLMRFAGDSFQIEPRWRIYELTEYIGFDNMQIDRLVYGQELGPKSITVAEGDFDEQLIISLLTDMGYTETEYGAYSYYGIREDYYFELRDPLNQYVMGAMNRMAVQDNRVIFAPATDYVTDSFDAMSDTTESIMDINACRALADSLGDVTAAVITPPERVLLNLYEDAVPIYYFDIPDDWGLLHEYDMVAMGYRVEGEQRLWDVALYYADAKEAQADSDELKKRMNSYQIRTQMQELEPFPLTDFFEIGEPQVQEYGDGAVLKICSRSTPEGRIGANRFMGGSTVARPRDVLFLAPDPSLYVAD